MWTSAGWTRAAEGSRKTGAEGGRRAGATARARHAEIRSMTGHCARFEARGQGKTVGRLRKLDLDQAGGQLDAGVLFDGLAALDAAPAIDDAVGALEVEAPQDPFHDRER